MGLTGFRVGGKIFATLGYQNEGAVSFSFTGRAAGNDESGSQNVRTGAGRLGLPGKHSSGSGANNATCPRSCDEEGLAEESSKPSEQAGSLGRLPRTRPARDFCGRGPRKTLAVHGDVNTGRQHLHKRERAAEIEEAVGAAKRVWNHRAGQDDGFAETAPRNRGGGSGHRVGAMGDDDPILLGLKAVLHDEGAIGFGHFEAVDHHDGANGNLDSRTSQSEHFRDVSILKKELPGVLVVFLIEGAAGDEDSDGHGDVAQSASKVESKEQGARTGQKTPKRPTLKSNSDLTIPRGEAKLSLNAQGRMEMRFSSVSRAFIREDVDPPERSGRKRSASGLPPGAVTILRREERRRLHAELAALSRRATSRTGSWSSNRFSVPLKSSSRWKIHRRAFLSAEP